MRLIRLNTVVLPAPLGPIRVNTSPWRTSKLTWLTASTPPKRTLRLLAERRTSVISDTVRGVVIASAAWRSIIGRLDGGLPRFARNDGARWSVTWHVMTHFSLSDFWNDFCRLNMPWR